MFEARVRVTRRQEFPRGSIVIAGALSRLKTSLQEQREGALLQLSPCPLSSAALHTLASLSSFFIPSPPPSPPSLSLSLSPPLPRNAFAPCSSTFFSLPRAASPSSSPFRSKNLIFPRPTYAIRRYAGGRRPRWYLFNFRRAANVQRRDYVSFVKKLTLQRLHFVIDKLIFFPTDFP